MRLRSVRIPYFRIWYSSGFITLFFTAWALTLVSPADLLYQSIRNGNIPNVFSIGGVYLLTILVSIFIWASRIYTNRTVLRDIPKHYVPMDYGDVPAVVHRIIVKQWERSSTVAWDSRPRDVREELRCRNEMTRRSGEHGHSTFRRHSHPSKGKDKSVIPPDVAELAWGPISHPGWSSPSSDDLTNLEYWRVIVELPNLIEAKAVSLAPSDPSFALNTLSPPTTSIPDARMVALLQRAPAMTLADYLEHLAALNLITPPTAGARFLAQYEFARFSTVPLSELQFRSLMSTFSDILAGMKNLDSNALVRMLDGSISSDSSSGYASSLSSRSASSAVYYPFSAAAISRRASSRYTRVRTSSTGTVRTAPSRNRTVHATPSQLSLSSGRSGSGRGRAARESRPASLGSEGSVIRLKASPGPGELPYYVDMGSR
ncbi:hypothetical protein EJ06DRAFT_529846 [Trichodelitschia bisporula]|uniref:Defect at low temperature protein 1 n=1 Tax=Trichodelitschia bisporula TaxID=703511 RepID=A0A6G1HY22_9PEZI|nr:hypothetical protein EJ06DRAFT_529846 [Trichodelitschia bisporula]